MAAGNFAYFSFLILFVLLLYTLILLIFLCIRRREIKVQSINRPANDFLGPGLEDPRFSYDWTTRIDDISESACGPNVRILLLLTRICSLAYIFGAGFIQVGIIAPVSYYYLDGWTLVLSFLYFFLAMIVTSLKIHSLRTRSAIDARLNTAGEFEWSYFPRLMSVASHMLFEICSSTTLLLAFAHYDNVSPAADQLATVNGVVIILFFVDTLFNDVKYRFDQYPAAAAWLMFYFLCIWPAVFTGSMQTWPYDFMKTNSSECFGTYTALFVASWISYTMWYFVYKLKKLVYTYREWRDEMNRANTEAERRELEMEGSENRSVSDRPGGIVGAGGFFNAEGTNAEPSEAGYTADPYNNNNGYYAGGAMTDPYSEGGQGQFYPPQAPLGYDMYSGGEVDPNVGMGYPQPPPQYYYGDAYGGTEGYDNSQAGGYDAYGGSGGYVHPPQPNAYGNYPAQQAPYYGAPPNPAPYGGDYPSYPQHPPQYGNQPYGYDQQQQHQQYPPQAPAPSESYYSNASESQYDGGRSAYGSEYRRRGPNLPRTATERFGGGGDVDFSAYETFGASRDDDE